VLSFSKKYIANNLYAEANTGNNNIMTPSNRIALNTLITYLRSLISAVLGLFSTRWVLDAIGQSDFGLFAVVGSIITFIMFLNGVMANSAARYFAYSIGEGDIEKVNEWFNSTLSIHLILPICLILIGWPVGEYCIDNYLLIPNHRLITAHVVFRISLLSAFVSMVTIPFSAMFTAKQQMRSLAVWGTFQSLFSFSFSYLLDRLSGDLLLIYSIGIVSITIVIQIGLSVHAMIVFYECRVRRVHMLNIERFIKILSFAGWSFIGSFGAILRNQGSAIMLNIYFGPKVNAAFGIANTVAAQVMTMSNAMTGAFSPEMNASEGRGDRNYMINTALRMCKFSTLLVMLLAIPMIAEVEFILRLWLHDVPQYSGRLCQLMLLMFIIEQMTIGYMSAVNAQGKIAAYQATLGTILVMTLPLELLFLRAKYPPTSVGVAFVITMAIVSLGRVYWGQYLLNMPVKAWFVNVFLPCFIVGIISLIMEIFIIFIMPSSSFRFLMVTVAGILSIVILGWYIVLNSSEKSFVKRNTKYFVRYLVFKNA
jgi:O-antigen/teichoic acid export membrane protein